MERLPPFKSGGKPTPPSQRAPAVRTTTASVKPPVATSQPQRPSPAASANVANGARPKTSAGEQKGIVTGSVIPEDPKTTRRGSLSSTSRR